MQIEGLGELMWELMDTLCSSRYLNKMIKYGVSNVIGEASWTRFADKVERGMKEGLTRTEVHV